MPVKMTTKKEPEINLGYKRFSPAKNTDFFITATSSKMGHDDANKFRIIIHGLFISLGATLATLFTVRPKQEARYRNKQQQDQPVMRQVLFASIRFFKPKKSRGNEVWSHSRS